MTYTPTATLVYSFGVAGCHPVSGPTWGYPDQISAVAADTFVVTKTEDTADGVATMTARCERPSWRPTNCPTTTQSRCRPAFTP